MDEDRGYSAIGVDSIKSEPNVGGVIRAAQVYGSKLVVIGSKRYKHQPTDTMKGYRHMPVLCIDDILDAIPFDCVPVGVELTEQAVSLCQYVHPERAFYIFGPEDGSLGHRVLSRCRDIVKVPTSRCMNLAACVNVVLYDRTMKSQTRH